MSIVQAFLDIALLGSAWVLWLLVALSIYSVAIIIERWRFFNSMKIDFPAFQERLVNLLGADKISEVEELCRDDSSPEAQVVLKGLAQKQNSVKAMEETMTGFLVVEKQHLDKGLVVLGTLGNNAPFIGLFGTVLGVIEAFNALGNNAAAGSAAVMSGISEALVATAVGLMVAIPAVIAFNAYNRVVRRRLANSESLKKILVAYYNH